MRNLMRNPWFLLGIGLLVALVPLVVYRLMTGTSTSPTREIKTNSIGMKFVRVSSGKFLMGSPSNEEGRDDDEYQHEVEIAQPFFLGIYEVTQEQFENVMGKEAMGFIRATGHGGPNHPAENVSWEEAVEFCKRLSELPEEKSAGRSYRLPTEAEWEYACRAGTITPFSFGSELYSKQANFDTKAGTREVGKSEKNGFDLHDMHGNVWEWCQDWYDQDYYKTSPRQDPQGPESGIRKVARGGSHDDPAVTCRSANRSGIAPEVRLGYGFRVVLVLEGER